MSALGLDSSYLDPADSGTNFRLVECGAVAGHVKNGEGTLGDTEQRNNSELDSLYQIAKQIAAGDSLDEVLASAISLINALVQSESCIAYVLHHGKFEPWIWQIGNAVRDSAPSLNPEVQRSLAQHRVPVALSRDPEKESRVRLFAQWSREPGETLISIPMLSRKKLVGAINFRHAPRVYTEREVKLLSTVGFIIGADIGISLAEAENAALGEELETRKVVERGKGLLQRDLRVSEQQAYLILEHLSRQRRKPLKDVAKTLILGDEVKRKSVSG